MADQTEKLRNQIKELTKSISVLQEKIKERTISNLCQMIMEEDGKTPAASRPQKRNHPPEDPALEGGAMLGLQLLRLQPELELLVQQPSASRKPLLECMKEIVRLTVQAGIFYRLSCSSVAQAGWFMLGCCQDETQEELLLQCMPLRYQLPLQQLEDDEKFAEDCLQNILMIFTQIVSGCVIWDQLQEGVRLMQLFAPAFAAPLGKNGAAAFYNQILIQSVDESDGTLAAAYGDTVGTAEQKNWKTVTRGDFYWIYGLSLYKADRQEETMAAMKRCHALRQQSFGPDHLLTLMPRALYWYVRLIVRCQDYDEDGAAFLVTFLERGLDHAYDAVTDYHQLMQLLGGLTFGVLGRLARMGKANRLNRLMKLYAGNCTRYDQDLGLPAFRKKYAYGLAGVLASMQKNSNRALEYTLHALETPLPEGDAAPLLDDNTLEYNAGYLCCLMGNLPEGLLRLEDLIDRMSENEDRDESIFLQAVAVYNSFRQLAGDLEEDEVEELQNLLQEGIQTICRTDQTLFTETDRLEVLAYSSVLELLYSTENLPPEDLPLCTRMVRTGLARMGQNTLFAGARSLMLYQLMLLLWLQDDPEALTVAESCARQIREVPLSDRIRASCFLIITMVQNRFCGVQAAVPYARAQLEELEKQWKNSVCTLDDFSLSTSMFNARLVFSSAYCILKQQIPPEQAFELVLHFKALASLAARERNRILLELRDATVQKDLEQLHQLQNRRTVLYTLPDQDEEQLMQIERELTRLSARIEAAMPELRQFTPLSLQALGEKLTEGSAVVEYYWAMQSTARAFLGESDPEVDLGLDVYVLRRRDQRVSLECRTLKDCDMQQLQTACEDFRTVCGDSEAYADREARTRKNALRRQLYQSLLQPVEDLLDGVQTLYIAPEELLRDIPYGLLGPDETHTLESRCTVVEMICSRDLLFDSATANQSGACVVGDPDYRANSREAAQEDERGLERGTSLYRLPFSRTEAELVAQCTKGICLVGRKATKQEVQRRAGLYGILHLAAHGDFEDRDADTLFRARIYLAGAQTFLETSREDPRYGNGILTANEISRMDLHGTWLVVLSACFSSLGESGTAGNIQGLVSAFAAAGVQYVVASLWEADDFATAELMRRFYQELDKNRAVPDALRLAKQSLAQATVSELRQAGWEALRCDPQTSDVMRDVLDLRLERADNFRPFADEHYWGGFVCHCCR